jgi:hypothetical protein
MRLIVPYVGELEGSDARLIRLAEFLGARCDTLSLVPHSPRKRELLESVASEGCVALLINPRVLQSWIGGDSVPEDLLSDLTSGIFSHLLVHSPRPLPFDGDLISKLSRDQLQGVQSADAAAYDVDPGAKEFCEAFSGLSFGPSNPGNDHVFTTGSGGGDIRRLISIDGNPFFAVTKLNSTEILVLGSADVLDLESPIDGQSMPSYFSRFVPHAMALRRIFGEECWRPAGHYACVVIDDPLLRKRHGFLRFDSLLRQVRKSDFHTSIAFIPYNYRRNSRSTVQMFLDNTSRLSICYHGNDHTSAEMASANRGRLSSILRIAESRMNRLRQKTGLACDKIMVFPQGAFSLEAMDVLKARNFFAAVNTEPYPVGGATPLTMREYAQPAVMRYAGFPLFLRTYVNAIQSEDMAFNLFFGRPALIVEHHGIFAHPELLDDAVSKVNSLATPVEWSNLQSVCSSAVLRRREAGGAYVVRAYSRTVQLSNVGDRSERCQIIWPDTPQSVEQILANGNDALDFEADELGIRAFVELPPRGSHRVSLVHSPDDSAADDLGLRSNAKAFVRRRLSELRDNYLSRNPQLLNLAQGLRRRFQAQGQR